MQQKNSVIVLIFLLATTATLGTLLVISRQPATLKLETEGGLLPEITNCTVQYGIPYSEPYSPYRVMDVYLPVGEGLFPAMIYIHGGGWSGGSRVDFSETALFYAKRGIAGFSIDYTLSTRNHTAWPENIRDIIEAIRYIRAHAQLYHIDNKKIAIMGSSSGAHLASLAGTLYGDEPFLKGSSGNEEIRKQVCLVVTYSGATDLQFIGENLSTSLIYRIARNALGNVSYTENPNLWIEASPATYVSAGDPSFCIVHGTNDTIVPIAVAESFNAKLQAVGVETLFVRVEDGDHDILTSETENFVVRQSLEPFLAKILNRDTWSIEEYILPLLFLATLAFTVIATIILFLKFRKP
ncbi:MAG: alpha/beta hydrolase [Candidatus Bathyarchaeota archaeon]|nr:alpha/beta hydrolase [Candidatus Bathyarchaeota archaeon]